MRRPFFVLARDVLREARRPRHLNFFPEWDPCLVIAFPRTAWDWAFELVTVRGFLFLFKPCTDWHSDLWVHCCRDRIILALESLRWKPGSSLSHEFPPWLPFKTCLVKQPEKRFIYFTDGCGDDFQGSIWRRDSRTYRFLAHSLRLGIWVSHSPISSLISLQTLRRLVGSRFTREFFNAEHVFSSLGFWHLIDVSVVLRSSH